jgi:hypothetical protein
MPGLPAVPYAPPPDKKGSLFGTISFSYSIVSLFGWIALFVVAGMLHKNDSPSDSTNVIVGAFMMGGLALNFIAMLLGVAGAVQAQKKTISILGACVNGMLMLGIFGIVLLGLASQGMRS